jgi:K+-sensing histidine kinase KdpD
VRAIAQAHGGRVWSDRRPGGGAVFRLALPLGGPPPAMPVEDEDAVGAGPDRASPAETA